MEKQAIRWPIVIHKDKGSAYGVTTPDLPGCFSAGSTIEEAIAMHKEAAECHIEGLLLDSEPVPKPSPIETYQDDPEFKGGIWAFDIDLDKLPPAKERINATKPELILSLPDSYAKKMGTSRSNLLV